MQFSILALATLFALPSLSSALPADMNMQYDVTADQPQKFDARAFTGQRYGLTVDGLKTDGLAAQNVMKKPIIAVVDSGSIYSYFPNEVTRSLYEVLNANPSFAIQQDYYADCNITTNFIFSFGRNQVSVPAWRLMSPIEQKVKSVAAAIGFPRNSCYVGIQTAPGNGDYAVLGQNFLSAVDLAFES